jgi:hypothetical protein
MTKGCVKEKLDEIVNEMLEGGLEHLSLWGVLGLGFLPGESILMFFFGSQVRDELGGYRAMYNNQFRLVLEYAEDVAEDGEADFEKYRDETLEWDNFYVNYEGDKKEELGDRLAERYRKIGEDLAPLVASDEDEFWDAARDTYTKDEIVGKLDHAFSYADIVEDYADDIDVRTPPLLIFLRLRYTDEVIRALREAENDIFRKMRERANEVFTEETKTVP